MGGPRHRHPCNDRFELRCAERLRGETDNTAAEDGAQGSLCLAGETITFRPLLEAFGTICET